MTIAGVFAADALLCLLQSNALLCKELVSVCAKLESCSSAYCSTQHDHFAGVCLEREVLKAVLALLHYMQNSRFEEPISNRFLHTSV